MGLTTKPCVQAAARSTWARARARHPGQAPAKIRFGQSADALKGPHQAFMAAEPSTSPCNDLERRSTFTSTSGDRHPDVEDLSVWSLNFSNRTRHQFAAVLRRQALQPLDERRRGAHDSKVPRHGNVHITTPQDFLQKLIDEQHDFQQTNCLSARHAINAAITAYHLHEWVWGSWIKRRFDLHAEWHLAPGKAEIEDFKKWIGARCLAFEVAEKITNGSKHFDRRSIATGEHRGAFQAGVFQPSAFDVSYLWIDRDGGKQRARGLPRRARDVLAWLLRTVRAVTCRGSTLIDQRQREAAAYRGTSVGVVV